MYPLSTVYRGKTVVQGGTVGGDGPSLALPSRCYCFSSAGQLTTSSKFCACAEAGDVFIRKRPSGVISKPATVEVASCHLEQRAWSPKFDRPTPCVYGDRHQPQVFAIEDLLAIVPPDWSLPTIRRDLILFATGGKRSALNFVSAALG